MRNEPSGGDTGRAQTDLIGYVILFSALLIGIGVVVGFGITALNEVQSATIADNGEFAMQAVSTDMAALYHGTATVRNTELSLKSASLETGPRTTVNVSADRGSKQVSSNATLRPIVYSNDDVDIAYENTLVIRDQQRGSVAVNDPLVSISDSQTIVPVVETNASIQSVAGGTRQVHGVVNNSTGVSLSRDNGNDVVVNITVQTVPDRVDVWERQLNESVGDLERPSARPLGPRPACRRPEPDHVTCIFATDDLVISHAEIEYEFR